MTTEQSALLRKKALEALRRLAVSPVRDQAALIRRVGDLALDVGTMLEKDRAASVPDWWRHQDLLDIRDFLLAAESHVEGRLHATNTSNPIDFPPEQPDKQKRHT